MKKIPESVAQNIMNEIKSKDINAFNNWKAKDFMGIGKSLQFDINNSKVIITQIEKNKYNVKYGKRKKNNIIFDDIIPIIYKYLEGDIT